jgi:hypothetical protein
MSKFQKHSSTADWLDWSTWPWQQEEGIIPPLISNSCCKLKYMRSHPHIVLHCRAQVFENDDELSLQAHCIRDLTPYQPPLCQSQSHLVKFSTKYNDYDRALPLLTASLLQLRLDDHLFHRFGIWGSQVPPLSRPADTGSTANVNAESVNGMSHEKGW